MASTLDYIVAAVGGCMTGTVAGALEARGVSANPDKLQVEAEGLIEDVDGKMILTGIKLHYRLKVPKDKRAAVERALEHHEGLCAASESVRRGITVEWESEIVEESESRCRASFDGDDGCPPIKRAPLRFALTVLCLPSAAADGHFHKEPGSIGMDKLERYCPTARILQQQTFKRLANRAQAVNETNLRSTRNWHRGNTNWFSPLSLLRLLAKFFRVCTPLRGLRRLRRGRQRLFRRSRYLHLDTPVRHQHVAALLQPCRRPAGFARSCLALSGARRLDRADLGFNLLGSRPDRAADLRQAPPVPPRRNFLGNHFARASRAVRARAFLTSSIISSCFRST